MTRKDAIRYIMILIAGFGLWNFGYAAGMNKANTMLTKAYEDKLMLIVETLNSACDKDFSELSEYYDDVVQKLGKQTP